MELLPAADHSSVILKHMNKPEDSRNIEKGNDSINVSDNLDFEVLKTVTYYVFRRQKNENLILFWTFLIGNRVRNGKFAANWRPVGFVPILTLVKYISDSLFWLHKCPIYSSQICRSNTQINFIYKIPCIFSTTTTINMGRNATWVTKKPPTSRQSATLQTPLQTAIVFIKSYDSQSYLVLVTSFAQLDVQSLPCDIVHRVELPFRSLFKSFPRRSKKSFK